MIGEKLARWFSFKMAKKGENRDGNPVKASILN
jgi:hypothetical protein